jgi:polygalacturonase
MGWDAVPGILARIKAPPFPARDFAITDYGAKGDGATDCTGAIKQAIAACNAAGGGRVVVSGGVFLTGAVHLKSNVNLYVAEGTTLKFDPRPEKYLPVVLARFEGTEVMNYSPLIYAFEQENIAVSGKGTLDGSASEESWWGLGRRAFAEVGLSAPRGPASGGVTAPLTTEKGTRPLSQRELIEMGEKNVPVAQRIFGDKGVLRPNFFVPYRCKNVLIEDVHIVASPMWEINPVLCTNVTVRGVNIVSHGPNNDGCDPDSCKDVLIENCSFDTGDDCIAIKSGKDADGRRVNVPAENLIIRNCVMKDGHGGVVLGSENSGGIRNVFAENCVMDSPHLERALRLKTNSGRSGTRGRLGADNRFDLRPRDGRAAAAGGAECFDGKCDVEIESESPVDRGHAKIGDRKHPHRELDVQGRGRSGSADVLRHRELLERDDREGEDEVRIKN